MKKILSVLLSVAMLVALLPLGSFAATAATTATGLEYTLSGDGTAAITGYSRSATAVVIPETIDGY